ncbi:MAG: cysteine desulfurase-like protein [bacterium]
MIREHLDVDFVRSRFPALDREFVFMDNAGGSQAAGHVINRLHEYFLKYNVQLGGSYHVSSEAGKVLRNVTGRMAEYVNASRHEEIIIGSSTTMLLRILSLVISRQWQAGDEVIITNSDHEANVSCWTDLQRQGIVIKKWKINPETFELELEDLRKLLTERTRLVAMVHASNILATVNPIRQTADLVHDAGALLCVDGVAYAPHRLIDVQELGVDFYVFSTYKVYGPHQSVMFGKYEILRNLDGINHYFIGKEEVPYKLQPGNFNFELTYGMGGIPDYFDELCLHHFGDQTPESARERWKKVFELIAIHEERIGGKLMDYLLTKPEIRIIGIADGDGNRRMPTISFVHDKYKSSEVVSKVDAYSMGIRYGDFYAKKIIKDLGLIEKDGVIRVSLVHYNTMEEVDRLIAVFETMF